MNNLDIKTEEYKFCGRFCRCKVAGLYDKVYCKGFNLELYREYNERYYRCLPCGMSEKISKICDSLDK